MVVLHIAPTPFFADRGCHLRIRNEIRSLEEYPVSVILCTYHHGRNIDGFETHRIFRIPGYTKLDAGFSPYRFLADILLFFLVLKIAWQRKPQALHAHLHEGALIGWAVKCCLFRRRLPLIMDMQGSLTGELESYGTLKSHSVLARVATWVECRICRMPDLFFCSSEKARRTLTRQFLVKQEKIALLQDGVPDTFFIRHDQYELKKKLDIPLNKHIVLYTGSLLPGKGVQHVLEAMRILSAGRNDMFFVLLGYPVDNAQAFVDKYGLAGQVSLPGQVAYGDLFQWLAVGDIALEPKEEEAGEASGKLLHYMASGLPVVCFNTLNNRGLLGDLGFYAEQISSHGLADSLEQALAMDNEALKMRGREGRRVIEQSYSTRTIGRILHSKYGTICRKGAKFLNL